MTDESDVMEVAGFIAELAKDVAVAHERAKLYKSIYEARYKLDCNAGAAAIVAKQAVDAMEAAFAWVCPDCSDNESAARVQIQ
jgi:hypothetical protein